jgi:hypothetical protein
MFLPLQCLLSFSIVLIPIKKAGKRGFLFTRRCLWLDLALLYHVPGFLLLDFKRPEIQIYLYLVLAFEILWHSPRVPADAASAILELAGGKLLAGLVDNCKRWCRQGAVMCQYLWAVVFAGLANHCKAD